MFLLLLDRALVILDIQAIAYSKIARGEAWRWVTLESLQGFLPKSQLRLAGVSVLSPVKIPALCTGLTADF